MPSQKGEKKGKTLCLSSRHTNTILVSPGTNRLRNVAAHVLLEVETGIYVRGGKSSTRGFFFL